MWWQQNDDEDQIALDEGGDDSLKSAEASDKDALLCFVDCKPEMFKQNDEGQNPFCTVMDTLATMMKSKAMFSPNDAMGVVFFNCGNMKNLHNFSNIFVHTALSEIDPESIQHIKRLFADKDLDGNTVDPKDAFEADLGGHGSDEAEIDKVLWVANSLFTSNQTTRNFANKRLFVFTCDDNPSPQAQGPARHKAKDLQDLNVEVAVFPLQKQFDRGTFYRAVECFDMDEDVSEFAHNYTLDELNQKLCKRNMKKRSLLSCGLKISADTEIAVRAYCCVHKADKGTLKWADAQTGKDLKTVTQWVCAATGALLEASDWKTFQTYGGERVYFTKDEMNQIKDFGDAGLTLLGFKPIATLKPYYQLKQPYFIYPDEQSQKGAATAFNALLQASHEKKKYALCKFIYRKGFMPRFVALVPQMEQLDEEGDQITAPGFHMIPLPFADDIRKVLKMPSERADPDTVLLAKKIVTDLDMRMDFDPHVFSNPALQRHFAALEALALDEPIDEPEDDIIPDIDGMTAKFQQHFDDFQKHIDGLEIEEDEPAPKRKRAAGGAGGAKKKIKLEDANIDFEAHFKNDTLQTLKVPQLKLYLEANHLKKSGKKADLVDRIAEHITIKLEQANP